MATDTQIQIVREDPAIEAYKLGLLESAKKLSDQPITLPEQQIAEMSYHHHLLYLFWPLFVDSVMFWHFSRTTSSRIPFGSL